MVERLIMKKIKSESEFVWEIFLFVISLPVIIIKIILRKEKLSKLLMPLREFVKFLFEPKITITLITINIFVFILEIFYLTKEQIENLVFQPAHIVQLNFYPIIASWFLHASVAHLAGNMLFLFIFGRVVEKEFGLKMLLIYFGSAIISDIVSAIAKQGGIGASGAIAGLVSTAILIKPFYLTYLIVGIPLPLVIVGWLAIISDITGILLPKNDNIGHFAHMGGYVATYILVMFFNREQKEKMRIGKIVNLLVIISIILFYLFFISAK
ncbi:MAG: rhomboid family intramembrane serine protease [Candidatus Woesearchaeota archaeon]